MNPLRVLHVDDEPDIREVVEISLGLDPDFEMRNCGSGPEALALVATWLPDIILMDVMMPGMDGPATLAQLRADERTAKIPVVFVTARAQTRELDLFRSLGAVGVIPKPFDPMTLAASVRAYVQPPNRRLDAMRNIFLQRVNDDAAKLTRLGLALQHATASRETLTAIRDIAHGLSGAGGIFGFTEIGNAAAALETAVIAEADGSGTLETITSTLDHLFACIGSDGTYQKELSHSRLDA